MKSLLESCDPAKKKTIPGETVLLAEGMTSGRIYVLDEGKIEVVRGKTQVAVVDEPGAVFGEMSVLLDTPHTATVRTLTTSTVYLFNDARGYLNSDPRIAFLIARLLAQRLNSATTYLVDLKRQYAGQGNHLGMVSDVLASLIHQPETEFTPGSDRQPNPEM